MQISNFMQSLWTARIDADNRMQIPRTDPVRWNKTEDRTAAGKPRAVSLPEASMKDFPVLFVDDDKVILTLVEQFLSRHGYDITVVDNGLKALEMIKGHPYEIVFTDYKMPQFSGLELLTAIKEHRPGTEVIIVSGYGTMESAIKAMKHGSYDYLQKPFKLEHLKLLIDRIVEEKKLKIDYISRRRRARERHKFEDLVGVSLRMQEVYETIEKIQSNHQPVLIQGESGTGKKLVAHTIHQNRSSREQAFTPANCAAIGKGISEPKLLEHLNGLFETAAGGTIFLDEISDLTPAFQARLIQIIAGPASGEKENSEIPADPFCVISATQHDIGELLEQEIIRKDLFDRLSAVVIHLPPLRERKEDFCLLINHFIYRTARLQNKSPVIPTPETLDVLMRYHWPGNLNQLEAVVERVYSLGVELEIQVEDLPADITTFSRLSRMD